MITELTIKNFKSFKTATIQGINRITLIGGRNNCGKTSLLEAIAMLFDMQDPNIFGKQLGARGVQSVAADPYFMWGPMFNNYDLSKAIDISSIITSKNRSLNVKYKKDLKRSVPIQQPTNFSGQFPAQIQTNQPVVVPDTLDLTFSEKGKAISVSHLYSNGVNIELHLEKMFNGVITKPIFFHSRGMANSEETAERFGRLDIAGRIDEVVRILAHVDNSIKSLSLVRSGNVSLIYADTGIGVKIPVSYMGDGVSRLLSLILAIISSKGGIVLVDEIENGIHHSVMKDIWKALFLAAKEHDCQLIATTHSFECLVAAYQGGEDDNSADEFSYIRLQKKGEDIVGNVFSKDLLKMAIDSDMEIR